LIKCTSACVCNQAIVRLREDVRSSRFDCMLEDTYIVILHVTKPNLANITAG